MKNVILVLIGIAAISFHSVGYASIAGPGEVGSAQQECLSGQAAKEMAVYMLNANIPHFLNPTVEKRNFTVEEIYGSRAVNDLDELVGVMYRNSAVMKTFQQVNNASAFKNLLPVLTRADIEMNVPNGAFCK